MLTSLIAKFRPQIPQSMEKDSRPSTTEIDGKVSIVVQKVGIPHTNSSENNNPVLTGMRTSIATYPTEETKRTSTSEIKAALSSSSSEAKEQPITLHGIGLARNNFCVNVTFNQKDSISVIHQKVLDAVKNATNDSDFMLCSIRIWCGGHVLLNMMYNYFDEMSMGTWEVVKCDFTKFSNLLSDMNKFPELQNDVREKKLEFYLRKANRLIENSIYGEIVNSTELATAVQELEKFQTKYVLLQKECDAEFDSAQHKLTELRSKKNGLCDALVLESRNYAEHRKQTTFLVLTHITHTLLHFKKIEGQFVSPVSTSTAVSESKLMPKPPVFTAEVAQGSSAPSSTPLKKAGMRKIMQIIFRKNAIEYIEKITAVLTDPQPFSTTRLGPLLKKPIISKAEPEVLNIFYQEGLYPGSVSWFIKEHLASSKAMVIEGMPYVLDTPCTIKKVDYRPRIKTKLATMEADKPRLIFQEILSDPSIKYLILAGTEGAKVLLQTNKAVFAANGYEIVAVDCVTRQSSIDAQHFLEAKIPLMSHDERSFVISELGEAGLRLVAFDDPNTANQKGVDFELSVARTINHEVIRRNEKRFPLSKNPNGQGKVIIWVAPDYISGIAKYFKRSETMMVGALESPTIEKESCALDAPFIKAESPLDVVFHFPQGTYKESNNEAKASNRSVIP